MLRSSAVLGEGPRPGRIFASTLEEGGFSGRPYLFVLGLDSSRFPRPPSVDPVLTEGDRLFLRSLPLPSPGEDLRRLLELLSEERKAVFLTFSCFDLKRDEETYPSHALVSIASVTAGNEGPREETPPSLEAFLGRLPGHHAFSPPDPGSAASEGQWWAAVGLDRDEGETREAAHRRFPHLQKGHLARLRRYENSLTEYDGCVPEAGDLLKPFDVEGGIVLSAHKLSLMGTNPFDFFLEEVLGVQAPPRFDPGTYPWPEPMDEGLLLHRIFQALTEALDTPGAARGTAGQRAVEKAMGRAERILDEELSRLASVKPPPGRRTVERRREEYLRVIRVFLENRVRLLEEGWRIFPEVVYGIPGRPPERTVREDPLVVSLSGERGVRIRGIIDAVELEPSSGSCRVCDYKTGSSSGYRRDDPFQGGRNFQPLLYFMLVEEGGLPGTGKKARVKEFLYFFPGLRDLGEILRWDRDELERGKPILKELVAMIERGVFPVSPDAEDLERSPYLEVHEDWERAVEKVKNLLPKDERLRALDSLRGS
ncbi:MAG: PD-(D/E)XK nuclease family protein [Thermus sp.]|uniref:PD-(D/E)XK nuclease family protein n=1 Tax=Thermus sp. TaxID=275 RepID=UPI0030AB54BD